MKKLKLLLLEDHIDEAEELADFLENNSYKITITTTLKDAEKQINNKHFDLIILDIMIQGKPDGISLAKKLNDNNVDIPFLFLSSMQTKLLFDQAKLTKPITYLLKPFNKLELLFSLELAMEKHYEQSNSISLNTNNAILSPASLFIKKNKSIQKVTVDEINYIEVEEKYSSLVCEEGNYLIKLSLTKVKELLSNPDFIQVHRNFLVNVKSIKEIYLDDNLIILSSGQQIPFSERHKAAFIKSNPILK